MSKKTVGSVAPKERVNISYKPAVGDAKSQIELPLKILVLGDFAVRPDERAIEDRETINVNKNNFDGVMASMDLSVDFSVPNRLVSGSDEEIQVSLKPKSLKDLTPDNLVESIPELKKVLELRAALKALKGPLGNVPQMRRTIQSMVTDESIRNRLVQEVGLDSE